MFIAVLVSFDFLKVIEIHSCVSFIKITINPHLQIKTKLYNQICMKNTGTCLPEQDCPNLRVPLMCFTSKLKRIGL